MGVEFSAKVILGLPYSDVRHVPDMDNMLDMGVIDAASPYYDAPREDWIVGVELGDSGNYSFSELNLGSAQISVARTKLISLTGKSGRLYLAVNGS
jgi:hypothetical protein